MYWYGLLVVGTGIVAVATRGEWIGAGMIAVGFALMLGDLYRAVREEDRLFTPFERKGGAR